MNLSYIARQMIANGRNTGYYDQSWSDEAIVSDLVANGFLVSGDSPELTDKGVQALGTLADGGDQEARAALEAAGYTDEKPLEQGLLDTALPGLTQDVADDAKRRELAKQLGGQLIGSTGATQGILDEATSGKLLQKDYENADRTTAANQAAISQSMQAQLAALAEATAAMQQNLQGDLAARAAALQQQIAALTANLDTLDATQRQALADQIAAMQQNLEQSIATQQGALQQELQSMQGAVGAQADAQRAALTAEIAALTNAQAPLAEARTRAAELQAAGVNAGLQSTQDQLRAEAAREGFIGGSTMQDAALARAAIDARQSAAQALGGARVANASDTRDIAVRGATGERTIAEALAQAQRDILDRGATGTRDITTAGALGKQQIGDSGAAAKAGQINQTALARANIGAQGANTTFQDTVLGADQQRSLADQLATGGASAKVAGAQQTQAAQIAGNQQKSGYYDSDYARRLAAATAVPALYGDLVGGLTALDNYGNSGLSRTQQLLNWWQSPSSAPTPEAVAVQPNTTGNSLSNLGSSLLGVGLNWLTPAKKKTTTAGLLGDFNVNDSTMATA